MTVDDAKKLFPNAIRVERTVWNGRECWKVVCTRAAKTACRHVAQTNEEWHFVEVSNG